MIGHALTATRRRPAVVDWDRWIAAGFAIGSVCFFVGPFPGFVQLVGQGADGAVFFAGSIFFTLAAALELREGTLRRQRRFADASWWSAAVQLVGTLLFNVSTFHAMETGLSTHELNRLVWAPDLLGSACFLTSGAIAYGVTTGPHLLPARWLPKQDDLGDGRREPDGMRAVRHLGDRFVCRAVDWVGARPGARQLGHRAGGGVLPVRRAVARAPEPPLGSALLIPLSEV
jgi:hypothetical protein